MFQGDGVDGLFTSKIDKNMVEKTMLGLREDNDTGADDMLEIKEEIILSSTQIFQMSLDEGVVQEDLKLVNLSLRKKIRIQQKIQASNPNKSDL